MNAKDNYGETALHLAVQKEDTNRLKHLLESNANVIARNNYGKRALHLAVHYG